MSINKISLKDIRKDIQQKLLPAERQKFLGWRIAYLLVIGALLASGLLTVSFVYQNIYNTLANSYAIVILSTDLSMDRVDMNAFAAAEQAIARKNTGVDLPKNLRNVFLFGPVATSTPTTTATAKKTKK